MLTQLLEPTAIVLHAYALAFTAGLLVAIVSGLVSEVRS